MRMRVAHWDLLRMHLAGWDWDGRHLRRRRWTPATVIVALVLGITALLIALTLLALALAGAVLLGGAYLGYRVLRGVLGRGPARGASRGVRHLARDARGLLEMARTPDPLDRYLIAVREFDRMSAAALAIDPMDLPRGGTARRIADLAEQAFNLCDAVSEIERHIGADPAADAALANVWELSVACGELWFYCRDLRNVRSAPTLAEVRSFITRRTALLTRRDALVARLRDAELRRPAPGATRIPVSAEDRPVL